MTIAVAVIFAAIAGALMYKQCAPRAVAWLLLCVGIGAAAEIMKYIGDFLKISFYGVAAITVIFFVAAVLFWQEVVKRNKMHKVRTPIVALLLGVSIISLGGTVGKAIHNGTQTGGNTIDKTVTTMFNKG